VIESPFESLRQWVQEHLDALDEAVYEADEDGILNSLRMIVTGELGCTEEADYTPEKWAVLVATSEATHV